MAIAAVLAITLDPGHADALHAHGPVHVPAAVRSRGCDAASLVGTYHSEERHPISRAIFARLRSGLPSRAAVPEDRHRARRRRRAGHDSGVPAARLRVHAPAERRVDPLHADDAAGDLGGAGGGAAADAGPGAEVVPRGRARDGEGRARGDVHRPGAVLDDGDHGRPQGRVRVAPGGAVVFEQAAARVGQGRSARTIWRDRITWDGTGRRDGPRAADSRRQTNAWTMPIKARIDMLSTGVRTPVGIKVFGSDLAEIQRIGERDRAADPAAAGHAERVRRTRDRRPLRRLHAAAGPAGPLRPDDRAGADGDHERGRRREHHHDDRGTGALPGEPALPARTAGRHRPAAARAGAGRRRRAGPARPARGHPARRRPVDDPRRERLHGRLRVRRHHRAGRGRLRRGGEAGGAVRPPAAAGLRAPVERPVREHDPRPRAPEGDRADHARRSSSSCSTRTRSRRSSRCS